MPKTLFIDSTPDIDRVWKKVHGAKDIAVVVNMGPVSEADVPAKVAGCDTVINDATYFSAPTLERCRDLKTMCFRSRHRSSVGALKYVASLITVSQPATLAGTSASLTGPMFTTTAMSAAPWTLFQTRSMSGVESMKSVLGIVQRAPDLLGGRRHVDVPAAQRVDHGVHHRGQGARATGLAATLDAHAIGLARH